MENQLQASTGPGRELVALAEQHAACFAAEAAAHDRDGDFPAGHIDALRESGFLYGPIPVERGGLGVSSVRDVLIAAARVARGDAATALGVNMHMVTMIGYARQLAALQQRGEFARAEELAERIAGLVQAGAFIASAVSEPDQDLTRPRTRADRHGSGWVVNGMKIFASGAPAATHFATAVTYDGDDGDERYAWVIVPRDTPGLVIKDDWDAMGMRHSGSATLIFDNCYVERGPGKGMPAGRVTADFMETKLVSGAAHAAASVGVAEAAHEAGVAALQAKAARSGREAIRTNTIEDVGENSMDVAAVQAIFDRALRTIERHYCAAPGMRTVEESHAAFAEVQRAKAFVNQAAVRIADRALAIAGGAGYMSKSPLSRYYRDARAGAFMHPLGANVAMEYIGNVTIGECPTSF